MSDLVFFNKRAKKVCNNINDYRSIWPPRFENKEFLNDYLQARNFVSNKNDEITSIEKNMAKFLDIKYFSFFDSGAG